MNWLLGIIAMLALLYSAVAPSYIADKYYQLGQLDGKAKAFQELAQMPAYDSCFAKGGCGHDAK